MNTHERIEVLFGISAEYASLSPRSREVLTDYDKERKADAAAYFGAREEAVLRGYGVRPVKDGVFGRHLTRGEFSQLQDSSE